MSYQLQIFSHAVRRPGTRVACAHRASERRWVESLACCPSRPFRRGAQEPKNAFMDFLTSDFDRIRPAALHPHPTTTSHRKTPSSQNRPDDRPSRPLPALLAMALYLSYNPTLSRPDAPIPSLGRRGDRLARWIAWSGRTAAWEASTGRLRPSASPDAAEEARRVA